MYFATSHSKTAENGARERVAQANFGLRHEAVDNHEENHGHEETDRCIDPLPKHTARG